MDHYFASLCSVSPEVAEARGRQLGVTHSVLDVAVPEIGLQGARVVPLVGQRVATGVPQHVRVRLEGQLGLPARPLNHSGKPRSAKGGSPFGREGRLSALLLTLCTPIKP